MGEKKRSTFPGLHKSFRRLQVTFVQSWKRLFHLHLSFTMKLSRVLQLFVTVRSCYYLLLVLLFDLEAEQQETGLQT